jgi:hypothetical protein
MRIEHSGGGDRICFPLAADFAEAIGVMKERFQRQYCRCIDGFQLAAQIVQYGDILPELLICRSIRIITRGFFTK